MHICRHEIAATDYIKRQRGIDLVKAEAAFAKYFNVNQSTIHRWENDLINIDARTLFWIEHVLGDLGFVYANKQRASQ